MPKTRRSPPPNAHVKNSSEHDLASTSVSKEALLGGVTVRSKRQCLDDANPAKTELGEIKCMLQSIIQDQEQKFSKLTEEIADLKRQNIEIQRTSTEIQSWMEFSNKMYEEVRNKIDTLEKQRKEDREYIYTLEQKIKDLEITSRNSILELRNIPAKEKESSTDLITTLSTIGSTIGVPISQCDIRDTYRIPSKPGTPKTIVVDFASVQKKDSFLLATKSFNKTKPHDGKLNTKILSIGGEQLPIYIAEYLPPTMKKLFYLARQFATQKGFQFCWTVNGKIFLRKETGGELFRIFSENCFKKLSAKN